MKTTTIILAIITIILSGCGSGTDTGKNQDVQTDTLAVADTGKTGITKYQSNGLILKEVTFKNGIREGLTKTFYQGGQLYQTFEYRNDLREDSSQMFYVEGQIFRVTQYVRDTIHGFQKQFYRTGEIKAKIGFDKGLRTKFFEEYTREGKLFKEYPEIVTNVTDNYSSAGSYIITLSLTDNSQKVKFYRGSFINNRFDSTACRAIPVIGGKGKITLKKSAEGGTNSVGIIASILTPFGNRKLVYKEIDLPYNDLK